MTEKNSKLIDDYLSGNLNDQQTKLFNEQMAVDPNLSDEFQFQSSVVEGIKEHRKLQLKTRLELVDVSPTFVEFIQGSALVKSFGGLVVASIIATGIYLIGEKYENQTGNQVINDRPVNEQFIFNWDINEKINFEETSSSSLKAPIKITPNQQANKKPYKIIEAKKEEADNEGFTKEQFLPSVSAPAAFQINDEEVKSVKLDEFDVTGTTNSKEEIEIETELTKSLNIKYKYYDGKLFLSGDFDRAPYEILEINSLNTRKIYINYLGKYYKVETTDKLRSLPEVTDRRVISELNLLKESKL